MFVDFFYLLREYRIFPSPTEFLDLIDVLSQGYITSIREFYFITRALLVKDESLYDDYDAAFLQYFKNISVPVDIRKEILDWLNLPLDELLARFKPDQKELDEISLIEWQEIQQKFTQRINQQTEAHNGGDFWIGTKGRSPFGWGGMHPGGIRVGGFSGGRSAIQVAQKRSFRNYRSDRILDVRQIQIALRKLRKLGKIGAQTELNLPESIRLTCQNAGEIELVWEKRKKNNLKLMLLMDVGGSMTPFTEMVEQLFSAASKANHFKNFCYFYFHNCLYEYVYKDAELWEGEKISLEYLFKKYDSDYRVVLVGDAAMAPYELTMRHGAIDYYQQNETPGIVWLKKFKKHFPHSVWLNPELEGPWIAQSRRMISAVFPMFPMTIQGLEDAIIELMKK
ncbi:MAG: VWA containing CoxE family protein [Promethearchaeia archaeon]|nr:MAG: VWA containing CoxE family protein [Candidatus Lokiarchaeia archaeon]